MMWHLWRKCSRIKLLAPFVPSWTHCARGIRVFQASGASFSPCAGQPCLVPHRPAADSQEPRGEAATGAAVARHTLQPAEPLLTPVQRGWGAGGLQQPPRGHHAGQFQQGDWGRALGLQSFKTSQISFTSLDLTCRCCWPFAAAVTLTCSSRH